MRQTPQLGECVKRPELLFGAYTFHKHRDKNRHKTVREKERGGEPPWQIKKGGEVRDGEGGGGWAVTG